MSSENNNFFLIISPNLFNVSLNARWLDYHICFCIQSVALYHFIWSVWRKPDYFQHRYCRKCKDLITPWWKGSRVSRESLGKSVGSCFLFLFLFLPSRGTQCTSFYGDSSYWCSVPKCVKSLDVVNWWYSVIYFKFIG